MSKLKLGDHIWVYLKGPQNDYGYGEICEVWYDDNIKETVFNFHCMVNGGLRMGKESDIIDKPNARMVAKHLESRRACAEIIKNKKWHLMCNFLFDIL